MMAEVKRLPLTRIIAALVCLGLAPCSVRAVTNDMDTAVLQTQQEIKTALAEINALRATIEKQRDPLTKTHHALNTTVRKKRQTLERMLDAKRYGAEQRRALDASVAQLEGECRFALTALSEYRRGLETRVATAALQHYRPLLQSWDSDLGASDDVVRLPAAASSLLPAAVIWNRERIGGQRIAGTALNQSGIEEPGSFLLVGPLCYFANTNGVGGISQTRFGSLSPTTFADHTPQDQAAIAALLAGDTTRVPVDVSEGDALSIVAAGDSFAVHVRKGGFVMVPLLIIGIFSMCLTLWKCFELRGMRLASAESLVEVIRHLNAEDADQAAQAARALRRPLSTLIEEAIPYRHAPREHLEEILHERILAMVPRLERHLGTLAVFGGVAPLLGLLGTVTGMIHTFDLVTIFGTGEARLLSGGISEALITTKFGLAIAIPVLLVHAFLARRVRTIVGALETAAVRFVNALKIGAPSP